MVIKLLRRATGSWTLERKSILFFGTTLLASVTISSWVMHRVTQNLVMQTTRQTAHDYAMLQVYNVHMINFDSREPRQTLQGENFNAEVRKNLYETLIFNPRYKARVLSLDMVATHWFLPDGLSEPVTGKEREILLSLESEFRRREAEWVTKDPPNNAAADTNKPVAASGETTTTIEKPAAVAAPPNTPEAPTLTVEAEKVADKQSSTEDADFTLARSGPDDEKIYREATVDGWYTYYHPVGFNERCLVCHRAKAGASFSTPFRVMRIMMPEEETTVWSVLILAVMISVAMVTLAVTLLILHLILRKLVVRPLRHLRSVSEEIIRGKLDRRAEIDTDDEFRELADAFNRMLRHLTESQQQLQSLNQTLDLKVDQLAQANLHLYEANRLKSDFLANMSHELRTPLNSIIGFSDVLQDISSLTDKQRRYAANIQKSGRMLLEMINDILDLAKIEAGKLQVKPLLFDIHQVLQAQCDMIRSLSEEKNIDVQLVTDNSLQLVFQDAPKIQQIVNNLLSNAVKFTPEGGLVTITTTTKGTDYFQIILTDTGVGIPETDFDIIFEKFRQSNAMLQGDNLTRQYSGTGLGLSIVKELCKLLGGEITLTSHVGKGSTFYVTLPRHYHNTALGEVVNPESLATTNS